LRLAGVSICNRTAAGQPDVESLCPLWAPFRPSDDDGGIPTVNNVFKYLKSTIQNMTNFGHFANSGGNKLSNCSFGGANFFSYYYFIYIFYSVFISCVIVAW
jgi:hypothetical protein